MSQQNNHIEDLFVKTVIGLIFKEINKIYKHINKLTKQQTKQQTKESLIDNLSKRFLELEFKHHDQIKIKFLKWIVKNILPNCKS